ncbi:hypothetical protein DAPPUDRAFT_117104 [Daphnia pulex]|uniref:Uncharacterized protein n=1 Tax=Daphnia pulex TaxID=6669 RepID=E9HRJ9_DAPPU|nr:hypothetical protein DAPPUDRAFT_117104 [Daphnia pulex]|eukprot:EFX65628.1 hypothetical protein DAPPUDRAFT_117104 [Daphnia pulex]
MNSVPWNGVTFINEGTPLHLAENGLYEIAYINISEEDMGGPANTDDADLPKADKEQVAITDCYLEGIVSFQDFMTRVENSDGSESGMEDSSDTDDEEKVPERNSNDPEYFPEESSKVQAQQKLKSSEHKGSGALPKAKGNQPPTSPVKKRKCTRATKRLPAHLQGLIGEANLRYARGENEDAINLCKEVIRQAPSYAEPFQALSMFYENQEDYEKSYQLSLIAEYLSPQDANECRCEVLKSIGAEKEQLKALLTMLRGVHQPENEQKKNEWVELAEKIFRMYFASGHLHSARRALSNALVTCADHFKMEHFNLLLELQILTKHYLDVIKTLNRHCGLVFNNKIIDEIDLEETESMELTKDLPLDILSKLCITLVYSNKQEFAFPLISLIVCVLTGRHEDALEAVTQDSD